MSAPSPRAEAHVVPARALGDGILSLTLAANLQRTGHAVTIHHDALRELAAFVPDVRIQPLYAAGPWRQAEGPVFVGDPAFLDGLPPPPHAYVFRKDDWQRDRHVLENFAAGARRHWGLTAWNDDPGLQLSPALPEERSKHVYLHPVSARENKNWPTMRFIELARALEARGYEPAYLLAETDADAWEGLGHPVVVPGKLDAVAETLRTAAGAIVTDSGIGHLAAAVGTPTLSLFRKKSAATFWRPAGAHVAVVTAPLRLPGRTGHRHWGLLLRPKHVLRAFEALLAEAV